MLTASTPLFARMLGRGYLFKWWERQIIPVKKNQQCSLGLCFPIFKAICSLIRYRKQLATWWWEPMEKNTLSINCVFLIPWFVGCGNRQHSGHCCSEIAFTDQSTRTGCIQSEEPGALHCRIVHRDGQCTLSLVWTQRTKERFYCKVWQVLFADPLLFLSLSHPYPSSL